MFALQNDALALEGHIFCGTRGWMFPTVQQPLGAQDEKVFRRELMRLRMSLDQAAGLSGQDITVLMLIRPCLPMGVGTPFTEHSGGICRDARGLGHLHGAGIRVAFAVKGGTGIF